MTREEILENAFKESKTSVALDEITTATISKEELHKVIDECNAGDYLLIQSVRGQVAYFFTYVLIKKTK
jgi:hypothetical protein